MEEGVLMEDRILAAADDLINQYGYRKFTMDDVSKSLGISKKTLYKYYSGKKGLISAVIDTVIAKDRASTLRAIGRESTWLAKIQAIIYVSHYGIPARMVTELRRFYPGEWKKAEALRRFKSEQIYYLLREGEEKGELNPLLDLEIIVPILEKMLEGLLQFDYLQAHDITVRRFLEQFAELMLGGIVKRSDNKGGEQIAE